MPERQIDLASVGNMRELAQRATYVIVPGVGPYYTTGSRWQLQFVETENGCELRLSDTMNETRQVEVVVHAMRFLWGSNWQFFEEVAPAKYENATVLAVDKRYQVCLGEGFQPGMKVRVTVEEIIE
jgi:hypothetical protein